jgi:NIPSNAP
MLRHRAAFIVCSSLAFAAVFCAAQFAHAVPTADAKQRVFEIRTYTTEPGKLPDLLKRFRDHTTKLFEKHGMTNIGYWTPADEPRSQYTLIYILAHDSRDAAKKSWAGFQSDPDWIKARNASEVNGKIVKKVESVFANPTDFSALK